jgi:hypothetical protein
MKGKAPPSVFCSTCRRNQSIRMCGSVATIECGHLLPCSECRDYNIEKVLRCERCCNHIIGDFVKGCSPTCHRNEETNKTSAMCVICDSHLRKEAKCCRASSKIANARHAIRSATFVLVELPPQKEHPTPKDRPCSHFSLCQYCKSSIIKGHRSNTACKNCKSKLLQGTISPPQKRSRVHFCMETGHNPYVPPIKRQHLPSQLHALAELAAQEESSFLPSSVNFPANKATSPPKEVAPAEVYSRIPIHSLLC